MHSMHSRLSRRRFLPIVPGLALAALSGPPVAAADEHLTDGLTARGVMLSIPRSNLREAVRVLSEATGVPLSVSPALADLQLAGLVPRRPLREIMGALESLFDGAWTVLPGSPTGYRLDLDPVRSKPIATAREALLKKQRKEWDDSAADIARKIQTGMLVPSGRTQQIQAYSSLIWHLAPPAARDRVMQGGMVTFPVPEAQARHLHELLLVLAGKTPQPLVGPMLVSIDLEDRSDTALPTVRTRATGRRQNSILSIITAVFDFPVLPGARKDAPAVEGFDGDFEFPGGVGESGRFNGTRDEILFQIARAANAPILSRHRAYGGSATGIGAGGRRLSQVMADLATACDGSASVTSRGYHLIRSRSEVLDHLALTPDDRVQAFLKLLPAEKKAVPFESLSELGSLTPLQLSVLHRSNVSLEAVGFARETYALIRFLQSLKPEQRTALFGEAGLEVASLSHPQLHAILDQRDKRGEFDIYEHLQDINGLRFRFKHGEGPDDKDTLGMNLYRGELLISSQTRDLPVYEKEPRPEARR